MTEAKTQGPGRRPKRPTSDAKRAANKKNAQHSTGPQTPEGKARASANSLKHGVYATRTVAIPRGVFQEDPVEVEAFLAGIKTSFPTLNPALSEVVAEIAHNFLRRRRLTNFEAELLGGAGRTDGDILGMTAEQARELKILDSGPTLLMWILKNRTGNTEDPRVAGMDWSDVDSEAIGRFLHHALRDTLSEKAPDLATAPTPTGPQEWDVRIDAILDACFAGRDEDVMRWAMKVIAKGEAQDALQDTVREQLAVRATDEVMARVAVTRTRLVRELQRLIECYRSIQQITGTP